MQFSSVFIHMDDFQFRWTLTYLGNVFNNIDS